MGLSVRFGRFGAFLFGILALNGASEVQLALARVGTVQRPFAAESRAAVQFVAPLDGSSVTLAQSEGIRGTAHPSPSQAVSNALWRAS